MGKISFRRIGGRIIPIGTGNPKEDLKTAFRIGAVKAATKTTAVSAAALKIIKKQPVKPNETLRAVGFGAAIADGIFSGATLFSGIGGTKGLFAGQVVGLGLSTGSTAANISSYAGKGNLKSRAKAAARQEAVNTLAGNAAFGATLLAIPSSRRKIIEGTAKALSFFKGKIGALL